MRLILLILRNLIAHEYHRIKEKKLLEMLKLRNVVNKFVEKAMETEK